MEPRIIGKLGGRSVVILEPLEGVSFWGAVEYIRGGQGKEQEGVRDLSVEPAPVRVVHPPRR